MPEKNELKPWRKQQWCIPKVSAEFVAHMEDVLDLYAEPYDPQRPVVCFDESSTQLLTETREPLPGAPGRPRREDVNYGSELTHLLRVGVDPPVFIAQRFSQYALCSPDPSAGGDRSCWEGNKPAWRFSLRR